MTAPTKRQIAEMLAEHEVEYYGTNSNFVCCQCGEWDQEKDGGTYYEHAAEQIAALNEQPETSDGMANTCPHLSASGIDTAPLGPNKVWRCDHCGMRWTQGEFGNREPYPDSFAANAEQHKR